jgi:mannonate dehydratase
MGRGRDRRVKKTVEDAGLSIMGIESVNVSDDIKIGTEKRDEHIKNYITTLENLGKAGIHMVCYNFMPVFDWTRSDLARKRPDGSTVLAYNQDVIDQRVYRKDVQWLCDARLGARAS